MSLEHKIFQNKDANRKTYINRCVEDIKADGICVLPAVNHLHMICKSYTKGTTIYSKADKATLGNLNEQVNKIVIKGQL